MSINAYLFVRIFVFIIAVAGSMYLVWQFILVRRILSIKSESGWNTDQKPIEAVIDLVNEATSQIEIYDDGNDMEDSLYNNKEFFKAIDSKLKESKGNFRVICLFNEDSDMEFKRHFAGNPKVEIYKRKPSKPLSPIHYKIIDGWKKAYLSRHGYGQHEREYRLIDCTGVKGRRSDDLKSVVFDQYRQDIGSDFERVST